MPVDLALFANPAYQHTAFEVRSLEDLRALHQRVLGRGVPVKMALNHGVSLSFYFDDPDGHLIEVYWPTGVVCRPRHGDPIDLTLPEEVLRRSVADLAAGAPPRPAGTECSALRRFTIPRKGCPPQGCGITQHRLTGLEDFVFVTETST